MAPTRSELRDLYPRWHAAQVRTNDIDPVYPWLTEIIDVNDLRVDDAALLVFYHVAWYHPGSTLAAFSRAPEITALDPDDPVLLDLPTGVERRGHRDKRKLRTHLAGLREAFAKYGPEYWVAADMPDDPYGGWRHTMTGVETLPGNGRWAAYKTAEMLARVVGFPISAPDAGHRFSTGPRKGLALLEDVPTGESDEAIEELDFLTGLWADRLGEPDIARVETSLCDFASLVGGRYYLGNDIDELAESLRDPRVYDAVKELDGWGMYRRLFGLPNHYGPEDRKSLRTAFRDRGELTGV